MSHSTEEERRRFYHRWSPFERMTIVILAIAVISMVATPLVQRGVDEQQNALIEKRAKEARECLSDRIDAIHDYLDSRGELADRDRINENRDDVADNRVLQSFAEAARTGNNAPALRALARWEEAQKEIVAEEKRIDRDRKEEPLPEFPEGDCLKELEAITPGPTDEPKGDGAEDNGDGGVSSGSDSSSGSSGSDSSPGANNNSGSSGRNGGGGSGGDGGDGGDGGNGSSPPNSPPNGDDDGGLIDLDLDIPGLLHVEIADEGQPKITPQPGGLLDPEGP